MDIENFGFNDWSMAGKPTTFTNTMPRPSRHLFDGVPGYNIFHAFIGLNLKTPTTQQQAGEILACLIAAELYSDAGTIPKARP